MLIRKSKKNIEKEKSQVLHEKSKPKVPEFQGPPIKIGPVRVVPKKPVVK